MGRTLWVFNPETDFALSQRHAPFTPPKSILALRRRLSLLPARLAAPGDAVLLLDYPYLEGAAELDGFAEALAKELLLLSPMHLRRHLDEFDRVNPWGWDLTIRGLLSRLGVPEGLLWSPERIEERRRLSHRRLTVSFNHLCNTPPYIQEIQDIATLEQWLAANPDSYLKAPWSSSGRGVLHVSGQERTNWRQWAAGTIRRQGSLMAERAIDRKLDCASEWLIEDGEVWHLGLSLFRCDGEGRYQGNASGSQLEIRTAIEEAAGCGQLNYALSMQSSALRKLVASGYEGPLGVDMAVDRQGTVWPCLEINLRHTMGQFCLDFGQKCLIN